MGIGNLCFLLHVYTRMHVCMCVNMHVNVKVFVPTQEHVEAREG